MRSNNSRWLRPLLAAVVLALIVAPIAAANGAGASAASQKTTVKQVKQLKKQTKALLKRVAALEGRLATPAAAAPAGPAGGDLSGSYPNPELRTGSVLSADIANGTIGGVDVANGAIGGEQIANGSILGADIAPLTVGQDNLTENSIGAAQLLRTVTPEERLILGPGQSGEVNVLCPGGTQLIGGGAEWEVNQSNLLITGSAPTTNGGAWRASAVNNTANTRTLVAKALCLVAGP